MQTRVRTSKLAMVWRAALALVAAGILSSTLWPTAAGAYAGAPWFEPGKPYTQNFPDPSVLVDGGRYYAYATVTGGSYLPTMSSADLRTWIARPAYDPGPPLNQYRHYNDGLLQPPRWAPDLVDTGYLRKSIWAPGVARIGGRYVAFYAVRAQLDRERYCISVATSSSPMGPFRDDTTGPLVCDSDPNGSIDPQPFVDPADGRAYLIWKSEGVPGRVATRIWSRPLAADGTSFAGGSAPVELLATSQPWEGNVIENPAMVRHQGRLFLFYSGNEHLSGNYATGYAECSSPLGRCTKHGGNPVLASRNGRLGPGGASPFVDLEGRLQLAYHYWNAPYTSYPAFPECERAGTCHSQGQRRMAIEEVGTVGGRLQVGDLPSRENVFAFGTAAFHGSTGQQALNAPIVGIASTTTGRGYWTLGSDGGIFTFGDAPFRGSTGGRILNQPVNGIAADVGGRGYWTVAGDGGVFSFGVPFHGSMGGRPLNRPVVGMQPTRSGSGYWLLASDGGIFSFGDAPFHGSTGGKQLNQPIVGMAADPDGRGYWFVAADGGVFSFAAAFGGSAVGKLPPGDRVVGMAAAAKGYWVATAQGRVFALGGAPSLGEATGTNRTITGITADPAGTGFWLAAS